MSRRGTVRFVAALVLLSLAASVGAQSAVDRPEAPDAEPYEASEFPRWALDLRRGEIIAFGSLPISLLASRLLYGLGRFVVNSIIARSFATEYLPPIIAPPGSAVVPLGAEENTWITVGAASISVTIAVVDYALGRADRRAGDDE